MCVCVRIQGGCIVWSSFLSRPELGSAQCLGGGVVGLSVAETAASITLLGNDGASAFAGRKAAAAAGTVGVAVARAGDELGTAALGTATLGAAALGAVALGAVALGDGQENDWKRGRVLAILLGED